MDRVLFLSVEVELFLSQIILLEQTEFFNLISKFDGDVVIVELVDRWLMGRIKSLQRLNFALLSDFLNRSLPILLGIGKNDCHFCLIVSLEVDKLNHSAVSSSHNPTSHYNYFHKI